MRPKKLSAYINRGDTYRLMNKNESAEKDYRLGLILLEGILKKLINYLETIPEKDFMIYLKEQNMKMELMITNGQ